MSRSGSASDTAAPTVTDARGARGEATVRIQSRAKIDRTAPTVAITSPAPGARVSVERLSVTGTASDNGALREVKVRVGVTAMGAAEPTWDEWVQAQSTDGLATPRAPPPP